MALLVRRGYKECAYRICFIYYSKSLGRMLPFVQGRLDTRTLRCEQAAAACLHSLQSDVHLFGSPVADRQQMSTQN